MNRERPGEPSGENPPQGPKEATNSAHSASGGQDIPRPTPTDGSSAQASAGSTPIGDTLRKAAEAQPAEAKPPMVGPDPLKEAWRKLKSQGITESHVLTDGAVTHETQAEWQCRACKAYNLALAEIGGVDRIIPDKTMRCWKCGAAIWASVEDGYHDPAVLHLLGPPRRATYLQPDRAMLEALREADALLDEAQLFPSDSSHEDKEPHWPHDVAVSIIGAAIHLARAPEPERQYDEDLSDEDVEREIARIQEEIERIKEEKAERYPQAEDNE